MLQQSGPSKGFWAKAMSVAAHILNCAPQKGLNWRTPYELLFGRVPEVFYLCIFGCCIWVLSNQGRKWDTKAKPMIHIGYKANSMAYCLWNPAACSIVVSANVHFDEHMFPNKQTPLPVLTQPTASTSKLPIAPNSQDYVNVPWMIDEYEHLPQPAKVPTPQPPSPSPSPLITSTLVQPPTLLTPSPPSSSSESGMSEHSEPR